MSAPGQLDFGGAETVDPRVERAAKALWLRDARKTFGRQDALELAKAHWPRVRGEYLATAEVALRGAGVL
jgi:hypothetical protein